MSEAERIRELIATVNEAVRYLNTNFRVSGGYDLSVARDINAAVGAIGKSLSCGPPPMLNISVFEENSPAATAELEQMSGWLAAAGAVAMRDLRRSSEYPADARFLQIINELSRLSYDEILTKVKGKFDAMPEKAAEALDVYLKKYSFWGTLDRDAGDFNFLENRAEAMHQHWRDFLWLYENLRDYRSKRTLCAVLENWYEFDLSGLKAAEDRMFGEYFDMDVFKCGPGEVFVDMGAYVGDTVRDYVKTYGMNYKRIYCYEISPGTFKELKRNLNRLPDVIFNQKAVSDKNGTMYIASAGDSHSNSLSDKGEVPVETVTADEDIKERVTFIKMDIEGAEQKAILGSAAHIKNDRPKLAVSVYHNNEDIWKIPRMIEEICPGYKFYLRYAGGNVHPTELSLLAVYPSV